MNSLNSDNIKLSYQDIKLSGFPFNWQVTFIDSKIVIIEQKSLKEISIPKLNAQFNYLAQAMDIRLDETINFRDAKEDGMQDYNLISDKNMAIQISFQKPVYFMDSTSPWYNFIEDARFDLTETKVQIGRKKIFSISDIQLSYEQETNAPMHKRNLTLQGNYNSSSQDMKINKAKLLVDLGCLSNALDMEDEAHSIYEHKVALSKLKLEIDDSSCDMRGFLNLNESSAPQGELDISLIKYPDIINRVVPKDFIVSASYLNKMIANIVVAENNDPDRKVDFKVILSKNGVSIAK